MFFSLMPLWKNIITLKETKSSVHKTRGNLVGAAGDSSTLLFKREKKRPLRNSVLDN